jgi:DNA-binding response OmpR family regulator
MSIRPSVMVVDDDEEQSVLFRRFLENSGFDSVSFTDPLSALDHISQKHNKYSVVITEWQIPNLNGTQLAEGIRNFSTTVKIFLTTAFFTNKLIRKEAFQDVHISDVIEKPVMVIELKPRIEELG